MTGPVRPVRVPVHQGSLPTAERGRLAGNPGALQQAPRRVKSWQYFTLPDPLKLTNTKGFIDFIDQFSKLESAGWHRREMPPIHSTDQPLPLRQGEGEYPIT